MSYSNPARFRGALLAALALAAFTTEGRAQAQQAAADRLTPELTAAKAALEKYQDPVVAIHDGYLSTLACVEFPKGGSEGGMEYKPGGMGVHFLNLGYIGPTLAPDKPQVLIYEPVGDRLKLVAAEWFLPAQAVQGTAPTIFGKPLEGPMMGHKPIMPEGLHHYDLHVWLWKDNPAGVFHPTNAALKCPKSPYTFAEDGPKKAPHKH